MAAVGLFTLSTSKLNEGILGGLGTGFAEATRTRQGSASGVAGFSGSANETRTRVSSATGVAGFNGTASATRSTSATATGSPGLSGTASASATTSGTAAGSPNIDGSASATTALSGAADGTPDIAGSTSRVTQRVGQASGAPDLLGAATATRTRSATASGTPDTPPTPPTPTPTPDVAQGGGPRLFYPQPIPRPQRPRETHLAGAAHGYRRARARLVGAAGRTGSAAGSNAVTGLCSGLRWPDDREVLRRKQNHDLILLELM